jgi:hypothetical protein
MRVCRTFDALPDAIQSTASRCSKRRQANAGQRIGPRTCSFNLGSARVSGRTLSRIHFGLLADSRFMSWKTIQLRGEAMSRPFSVESLANKFSDGKDSPELREKERALRGIFGEGGPRVQISLGPPVLRV